jgi:hypothetical protein
MDKIYSKIQPNILLYLVYRFDEINCRTNISPDEEFLHSASQLTDAQILFICKKTAGFYKREKLN